MTSSRDLIFCCDPFHEASIQHEQDPQSFLMPLGGYSKHAALSSLSLGYEIMEFHKKTPLETVILDAGTGLQAASALVAMQDKGYQNKAYVIAMGNLDFESVLSNICQWTLLKKPTFEIEVIRPTLGASYGSWNQTLERYRGEFLDKTGIILDRFYNTKSFYTLEELIKKNKTSQTCLIVHSGGTFSD